MRSLAEEIEYKLGKKEDEKLQHLIFGLYDAFYYGKQVGSANYPGVTHNEFWTEIEKIPKALLKIATAKGTAKAAYNSIEKAIPVIPKEYWFLFDQYASSLGADIYVKKALEAQPNRREALFLLRVFTKLEADKNNTGKGNARKSATKHLMAIQKLAEWFTKTLDVNPSAKYDSRFYKYVEIFFKYFLDEEYIKNDKEVIKNYERHIKNALQYKWKQ